jgi:hypothetical protein
VRGWWGWRWGVAACEGRDLRSLAVERFSEMFALVSWNSSGGTGNAFGVANQSFALYCHTEPVTSGSEMGRKSNQTRISACLAAMLVCGFHIVFSLCVESVVEILHLSCVVAQYETRCELCPVRFDNEELQGRNDVDLLSRCSMQMIS